MILSIPEAINYTFFLILFKNTSGGNDDKLFHIYILPICKIPKKIIFILLNYQKSDLTKK